ncbi:hypothetical protein V5P93_005773 [Actinokineospora auranticolor]|uniref:Uncharacterized protein n=1 Tax=Actinokineospora auranticolor TaxID=155976 RepID=A0A2S6GJN6_9PSEU|nr:hypothetical protein [Actinokineospora auranticolor]PPK65448.1 hypothetical protein CLV40_114100 [Actinokineospora auranticolor]
MLTAVCAVAGALLVVLVWLSVLRTVFIPRFTPTRTAKWSSRLVTGACTALARRLPRRAGERVMEYAAPLALFTMAACWLVIGSLGFFLLGTAVHGSVLELGEYARMLVLRARDDAVTALAPAIWLSTLLISAAFTVHLLRFTDAYSRRERLVTSLASRAREPLDAEQLLATHARGGSRDGLDRQFKDWLDWLADVHATHSGYPALVHYRSVCGLTWVRAAVIMLDAAALVAAVAPTWAPPHTSPLLHRGRACLQDLAGDLGSPLPAVLAPVSLQGREERAFGETVALMVDAGLPAERDPDQAWWAFQCERGRYAPFADALGHRLLHDRVEFEDNRGHGRPIRLLRRKGTFSDG